MRSSPPFWSGQRRDGHEGSAHHLVGFDPGAAGPAGHLPQDHLPPGAVCPLGFGRAAAAAAGEPPGGPVQRPHRGGACPHRHHGADGDAPHPPAPADGPQRAGDRHPRPRRRDDPRHRSWNQSRRRPRYDARDPRHPGDGARRRACDAGDACSSGGYRRPPLHHCPGPDGPVAHRRGGDGPLVPRHQSPLRPLPAAEPEAPGPPGLPPAGLCGGGHPVPLPRGPLPPRRLPDPRRGRGCAPGAPRPGP